MQYEVVFKWGEITLVSGEDFADAMINGGWGDIKASEIARVTPLE